MTETKRIVIERIDAATGNTKKSMNLMLELVRTMVGQLAEATGMPEKFVSRAADAVLQALKEIEPHLRTAIALEYAAHYSEEELEEMVRFYESTTGRRMQEMQPSFDAKLRTSIESLTSPVVTKALEDLTAKMKAEVGE